MKRFFNQHYSPVMLVLFIGLLTMAFVGLSVVFGARYFPAGVVLDNHGRFVASQHLFESVNQEPPAYEKNRVLGVTTEADEQIVDDKQQVENSLAQTADNDKEASLSAGVLPSGTTPTSNINAQQEEESIVDFITAYFTIQTPKGLETFSVDVSQEATVLEAMQVAQAKNKLTFVTRSFASLGDFVTSINNLESGDGVWVYDINGQLASKGVSFQKINHGDRITWRYDE